MGDDGGNVGMALVIEQIDAIQPGARSGAGMSDAGLQPLATRASGQDRLVQLSARRQIDLSDRYRNAARRVVRQHHPLKPRAPAKDDPQIGLGGIGLALPFIAFEQQQGRAGLEIDIEPRRMTAGVG